jgi:hypothetical protein
MAWVRIDEHFYDHPKWADAPGDSIALWLAAMAWCNRNESIEGYIPARKTRGLVNVRNLKATLVDLVKREAIHVEGDGYVIHDYAEFQQPEKVREIARKRARAGAKGAAVRWGEHRRRAEMVDDPGHTDDMAPPMANGMASAIAKTWPDTDSDSEGITSVKPNITSVVPNGAVDISAWAGARKL